MLHSTTYAIVLMSPAAKYPTYFCSPKAALSIFVLASLDLRGVVRPFCVHLAPYILLSEHRATALPRRELRSSATFSFVSNYWCGALSAHCQDHGLGQTKARATDCPAETPTGSPSHNQISSFRLYFHITEVYPRSCDRQRDIVIRSNDTLISVKLTAVDNDPWVRNLLTEHCDVVCSVEW